MKIPYGVADFYSLRTEGQVYVDRTDRIPVLEELGKSILFLRPRRFGKSLWLSTLANYYDLRTAEEHERLFGGLAIGREASPLAHRFFVLRWDFSKIDPDPPPRGVNAGVDSRSSVSRTPSMSTCWPRSGIWQVTTDRSCRGLSRWETTRSEPSTTSWP